MEFKLKEFDEVLKVSQIANIHYYEFTREYNTFENSHKFRELVYVDNGCINVHADNYRGNLKKNELIIHQEDETHSLTCVGENAPNVIIIGFECDCKFLDVLAHSPVTLSAEQQKLLTDVIREGRSVFLPPYDIPNQKDMKKRPDYPFGADQMIRLKLETLLIELIRGVKVDGTLDSAYPSDLKITDIYNYITENYKENITLNEICFLFSTNKTSVCYSFKKIYGITVVSYINMLKVKEAKKLMREGKMNLTQIAESLGFSSLHYFSRVFRKYEEKSPTDYIETIKARLNL